MNNYVLLFCFMNFLEFIYYYSGAVLNILIVAGLFWFVSRLSFVRKCEREINKLHKELENGINKIKDKPISLQSIEGQIKRLRDDSEPSIKEIERKRKFALDKLPFVK